MDFQLQSLADAFTRSAQDIIVGLISFIPNIIVALLIFLLGWVFGAVLGKVISQFVKTLKVDNALRGAGLEEVFTRAGFVLDSGRFLGGLVKWFVIIIFLVGSLDVLELNQVNDFLQNVVLTYLPNVIAAVLILLVAAVIAEVMQNIVVGSAKAAHFRSAHLLGAVTRWSIWVFAILAALSQLSVASGLVQTLFTGIVIAVSLAVGLAFGLGGQDAAREYIGDIKKEISHKKD